MAKTKTAKLPYPPSPRDVPDGYTDFPPEYIRRQRLLVLSLYAFLVVYFGLLGGIAACGLTFVVLAVKDGPLWLLGIIPVLIAFALFVKGLFKSSGIDRDRSVEIVREDHPLFFAFIDKVCEETGADAPARVIVDEQVNAAMVTRVSLANLFRTPDRELLVGLGLVNVLNLSEFKAVVAHEFGHFTQVDRTTSAGQVVERSIVQIVVGRDGFDRWVDSVVGMGPGWMFLILPVWAFTALTRVILVMLFKAIALSRTALSREREFHADRVAAALAGSDAVVHCLLRGEFGARAFDYALDQLRKAADHDLYTADVYHHQTAWADAVGKADAKAGLRTGERPKLDGPRAGRKVQVFDRDEDREDDEDPFEYHPPNADREDHVKDPFVPCPIDERPAWVLFADDGRALREKFTRRMNRKFFKMPRNFDPSDPAEVDAFFRIEEEEVTYDPRYQGAYDERTIDPGSLEALDAKARDWPWRPDQLKDRLAGLYKKVGPKAERLGEVERLLDRVGPDARGYDRRRKRRLERERDDLSAWLKEWDETVYLIHTQMARAVDEGLFYELRNRYRFHLTVQGFYRSARFHQNRAHALANLAMSVDDPPPGLVEETMRALDEARGALKRVLRDARDTDLPAMKHFEEGARLADFLLDEELISELPFTYVKGKWIIKLLRQLDQVRRKSSRLHFKSLGGILALQERVAAEYLKKEIPVLVLDIEPEPVVLEPVDPLPPPLPKGRATAPRPAPVPTAPPVEESPEVPLSTGGMELQTEPEEARW